MSEDVELAKLGGYSEFTKQKGIAQETEVPGVPFVPSSPGSEVEDGTVVDMRYYHLNC